MHVPDGFLDVPTSVGTAAVAAVGIGFALKKARNELDERTAPLAGLAATFIFAAQMVNFPVGAGTSGHLIGGALAAVLVGPWTATLCLTVVLLVQAFLFADGGITALGTNVVLMALVAVWVGWGVTRLIQKFAGSSKASVALASTIGAYVSVPAAALVFAGLFAIGGAAPLPIGTVAGAMLGVHAVIGIGEALITFLVVSAVLSTRPDLVYAGRGVLPETNLLIKESVA